MKPRRMLWYVVVALLAGWLLLVPLFAWLTLDRARFGYGFIRTKVAVYHLEHDKYPHSLLDPAFQALVKRSNVSVAAIDGGPIYAVRHLGFFRRHDVDYVKYRFIDDGTEPVIAEVRVEP